MPPVRPRGSKKGGTEPMKRLCVVLSLVLLLIVLALPALARADSATPDGWTWDQSGASSMTLDGWTWDEA